MRLSVVIPALDEESVIAGTLAHTWATLAPHELLVADTGSTDATELIAARSARVMTLPGTRGAALNQAARLATGDVLLFVHADTLVPADASARIERALRDPGVVGGAFRLRLDDKRLLARLVSHSVNLRSAWLNTFFGDQAMFVRRDVFLNVGGYQEWSVMEDLEILSRLRRHGRLVLLDAAVVTSARRHRRNGWFRTIGTIWALSALSRLGVPGQAMAWLYRPQR